jgi:hypothetical protein
MFQLTRAETEALRSQIAMAAAAAAMRHTSSPSKAWRCSRVCFAAIGRSRQIFEDAHFAWLGLQRVAVEDQHEKEERSARQDQSADDEDRDPRLVWQHEHQQRHDQPDQRVEPSWSRMISATAESLRVTFLMLVIETVSAIRNTIPATPAATTDPMIARGTVR